MQNTATQDPGVHSAGDRAAADIEERLLRLRAPRREHRIELRVHYEIRRTAGCDVYRIITIDEVA